MDEITIMGIRIKRSPASRDYKPEKHCAYLNNGFCKECDCEACEGGYLIDEWREAIRQGRDPGGPRECACVRRARNQKRIRDSGLEKLVEKCTFDNFRTVESWQAEMKRKAFEYLDDSNRQNSFFIAGQSGSGKTHLCTAICNEIMKDGGRLIYFQYVKDGTRLKQIVNEREQYEVAVDSLIEIPFLCIDDLFKQEVSSADIRLMYEIINGRHIAQRPTIISSERSLAYIKEARNGDGEAIAGRIFEACGYGRFCIELTGSNKNQRFCQVFRQ